MTERYNFVFELQLYCIIFSQSVHEPDSDHPLTITVRIVFIEHVR